MSSVEHVGEKEYKGILEQIDRYVPVALMREQLQLSGINARYQVNSWFLVVRATNVKRERVVAYIGGRTLQLAMKGLLQDALSGELRWKKDKYQNQVSSDSP